MNDTTPNTFSAMVDAGRRDVVKSDQPVYITHEQAVRLYGDPANGSTYDENSILGALFDMRAAVLKIVLDKGGGDINSPANQDYTKLVHLFTSMMSVMTYAKSNGLYFRSGGILGQKLRPLEEAKAPLRQNQWHLKTEPAVDFDPMAPALETKNFLGWVRDLFDMTERHREDLGETTYQALIQRFGKALPVTGISEAVAGFLPETTLAKRHQGATSPGAMR